MNNFPIKCDHPRLSITVITKPTLHIFSLTSPQPNSSFQSIPPKFQFLLYSNLRFLNQHNIICKHHTPRNVSLNSSCQFVHHHYGKEKWTKSRSLMHPNRNGKFFCPPNINVKVPLYGCDCYAYALLASGYVDLVIESGLKPYDFLSLIPVIEGAGGVITDWKGHQLHWEASSKAHATSFNVIAAGDEEIHREAIDTLLWQ
ncbi:hypothetical protein OROHE_015601 [Orobanche hederae]